MTRKEAIRFGVSFAVATALGKYDALAQDGGYLTIDLNQWRGVTFKLGGKKLMIPVAEVFAALEEGSNR